MRFGKRNKTLDDILNMKEFKICSYLTDWIRIIDIEGNIVHENSVMVEACGPKVGENAYKENSEEFGIPRGAKPELFKDRNSITREVEFEGDNYLVRSSAIYDDDNNIVAIVEDFRNITIETISIKRLEEIAKKTTRELSETREIQKATLPRKGEHNGIYVDYKYIPSEYLSGDMFDIIEIDDDKTAIYIADVVGHGISAAFITMFVRQTMRYLAISDRLSDPNILLRNLIKKFGELNLEDTKYFTIFYGVYSKSENEFKYANAGHNAIPIKISKDGEISLIEGKGLPISYIFSNGKYISSKINIDKGDKILFYTDGITETKDYFNEFYGIDRLINVIEKKGGNLLDKIVNSVSNYRWGPQEDDIALLLIERMDKDGC